MLKPEIASRDYYQKKLTMFLKQSYGIPEYLDTYWKILHDIDQNADYMMKMLDVWANDYISVGRDENGKIISSTLNYSTSEFLDKIAYLVGCQRVFNLNYRSPDDGSLVQLQVTLSDWELLVLIKTRIIRNTFDGTRRVFEEGMNQIFSSFFIYDDTISANTIIFISEDDSSLTDNIKHLFYAGELHPHSVGITYNYYVGEISTVGQWDVANRGWDRGFWV